MEIRPITMQDQQAVQRLFQQVHDLHSGALPHIYKQHDAALSGEEFLQLLEEPKHLLFGAQVGDTLAGFCHLSVKTTGNNPLIVPRSIAYMEELVVDRAYRGQGIAKALFARAKAIAAEQNLGALELMVWAFNQDAIRFYEKMGMTVQNQRMEMKIE